MNTILVAGYKSFDVGVFSNKDPRLTIIKKAIERDLRRLFEEGVKWLVFSGNLGFEAWVLEVAFELKKITIFKWRRSSYLRMLAKIGMKAIRNY